MCRALGFLVIRSLVLLALVAPAAAPAVVVDFEDLTVPPAGYFNGDTGTLSPGQSVNVPWTSQGVSFDNTFAIDDSSGFTYSYWLGFAYSNVVNTTDPAFENQYASYPGGGAGSSTYAVAYADGAALALPAPATVTGFQIANTTYAALTMKNGDQYGFSPPLPPGGAGRRQRDGRAPPPRPASAPAPRRDGPPARAPCRHWRATPPARW
jgi:hypothetical protein